VERASTAGLYARARDPKTDAAEPEPRPRAGPAAAAPEDDVTRRRPGPGPAPTPRIPDAPPAPGLALRLPQGASMLVSLFALLLACSDGAGDTVGSASAAAPAAGSVPAAAAPVASAASDVTAPGTVVATWSGGSLTYADATGEISSQLVQLRAEYLTSRYDTEAAAVDERVNKALLEAEAKKRGLADVGALLKAEVEDKAARPTDAEVQELYDANARRLGGRPLAEVRPDVERAVLQRKQGERYEVFITELRGSYGVKVTLPFPDLPRVDVSVDDDPSVGPADAPVTIVQFAEFQCPYCGKAREATDRVMKEYEGKVRIVFRDFPLNFHDRAIPAAVAANCAARQDKYWKVHDTFMANQRALEEADLVRAAKDAGVDMNAWQKCRTEVAMEEEVKKDLADGAAVGVSGTPAFFVNGIMLSGAQPFEKFKVIIDRELQKKG
jgi:protein-disulfide isomerase